MTSQVGASSSQVATAARPEDPLQDYAELVATEAYIYGLPIVGMYELLNVQVLDPTTRRTDFNEFSHSTSLASAKTNFIPAPNNDTVYSRAWLDLRAEPVVLQVPDTGGRYYTIQVLDLFSETLDNVGKRRYGTSPGTFAFVGPDWRGELPAGVRIIRSNTPFVLAFLRILVNGEDDLPAVTALQQGFHLAPLSCWQRGLSGPGDTSAVGLPVYKNADARDFFGTLQQLLKLIPVPAGEAAAQARFKAIGIGPEDSEQALAATRAEVLETGMARGKAIVSAGGLKFGAAVNYWRIARVGVGAYGYDYLQRAVVWLKGALANVPEESLYPSAFQDSQGQMLDGNKRYVLHLSKEQLPPASQFWSLTMYIFRNGFLVDNPLNRYSVGDRTPGLVYGQDGSLTIYMQNDQPGPAHEANWLPAPPEPFYVTLRIYGPSEAAITGAWAPPAIECVG